MPVGRQMYSLFTKAWKRTEVDDLCRLTASLGFDGIELPLRAGYQIEPEDAQYGLARLTKKFDGYGLKIFSVASENAEYVYSACANAGIPEIRIMVYIDPDTGYMKGEYKIKKELEKTVVLCEKYEVRLAIQQHFGHFVSNSMQMLHLVEEFDPRYIGVIWDAGHSGLAGEEPELALDICWSHLCRVNLKSAYYKRVSKAADNDEIEWERYFTTAKRGLVSWKRVAGYLNTRGYSGVICLCAEYTDEVNTEKYIAKDIVYARSLFDQKSVI